ncbi:SDR family oxidoreductase [Amycolatopsis sp.]|uniref:SDR family NAD(P)-dependent oxidoreductase n=1 Tax=Amycolatopsis sp. TaxID=37632 RepID=UPI002C0268AA|nr:SDR family oxidoreductase [Amycolatopsis sp.]HVV08116.1 SDR family oxidoreductase [Amycolatopsis sp.]
MTRTDDTPVPDYGGLLRLDGRGFIVIGAGQGMGRQAAHALAGAGARVLCVDQDPELAEDIAKEVSGTAVATDVTKRENVQSVVDSTIAEFGKLDGIVDIVGLARWGDLIDLDDETWDFEFDICLRHAFLAMQTGARAMAATGGGAMAFVASISGLAAAPNHPAYGAAKAGLMSLVRTAAVEYGPLGIRVNAVAPGATLTPRISAGLTPERRAQHESLIPTGRLNKPADIAAALLFLVSDLSGNVSGQTLVVDGGVTCRYAFQ